MISNIQQNSKIAFVALSSNGTFPKMLIQLFERTPRPSFVFLRSEDPTDSAHHLSGQFFHLSVAHK